MKHRGCEAFGARVVARAVIAADKGNFGGEFDGAAMFERMGGEFFTEIFEHCRIGNRAQRNDKAHVGHGGNFVFQKRAAGVDFYGEWFV